MPLALLATVLALLPGALAAHGVAAGDAGYIQEISGIHLLPFVYLGAKHMVTGYDHLLFLFGVVFFLYRLKDVGLYVSLFALGHSLTLMAGVILDIGVSAYLVDAIIGLSVVYKALDNLGAFRRWFGVQPDPRAAACSTASGWPPRSRTTASRPMGWCRTSSPSMSGWRSGRSWHSRPSSSRWAGGGAGHPSPPMPMRRMSG